MKLSFLNILALSYILLLFSCKNNSKEKILSVKETQKTGYKITPVGIEHIKMADEFWFPMLKKIQGVTIPYSLDKCVKEGRFDNFLIAGGKLEGTVKGAMPFDDSDIYKIIEGASYSLMSLPNPTLERQLDSIIEIIKIGQEEDGYITTWRTINPAKPPAEWVGVTEGKRWESLSASHELYNAGHMYEAAVAHYKATGKKNFLDIALKNADLVVKTFGDDADQISAVPGHQIIETGLIRLYEVSEKEKYLNMAKYFLDNRGNPENHDLYDGYISISYTQDHLPVVQQEEAVGHAVRAVYMYAGMTDIAAIKKDSSYLNAVYKIWNNLVGKKFSITGGIGSRHEGEAFGDNYELPNLTAYNETCASIGNVSWNHRLHNLTGDVKYFDVVERTLYNGLISGISMDGTKFFYPNALESDGVYKFNQGACTRKDWFDCSCCPTNLIRFLPTVPGLLYSKAKDTLYINLYTSNEANVSLESSNIKISQQTQYPLEGKISFEVSQDNDKKATLKFRIPGWTKNEVVPSDLYHYLQNQVQMPVFKINGKKQKIDSLKDGYFVVTGNWHNNTLMEIEFPMEVRKVMAHDNILEDRGKTALEYGPFVYAFEEIDNPEIDSLSITIDDDFMVNKDERIFKNLITISNGKYKAVPYYAWSNREVGKMKIWLDLEE